MSTLRFPIFGRRFWHFLFYFSLVTEAPLGGNFGVIFGATAEGTLEVGRGKGQCQKKGTIGSALIYTTRHENWPTAFLLPKER